MSDTPARELLARCSFPDPAIEPLGGHLNAQKPECAVSGGADSTALAVLAVVAGLDPVLVYVDHGLRPSSAADGEAVRKLADELGVAFDYRKVSLEPGPNLEARARDARYGVLANDTMTGHTADDLAETMLYNMMRGAGLDGLSPMLRNRAGAAVRRPIIRLRRSETVDLCTRLGIHPIEDSMNLDPAFARVRVRRELLPLMTKIMDRDVVGVMARQAAMFADEVDFLETAAAQIDASDCKQLRAAPVSLARRALRNWLLEGGVSGEHRADSASIERILAVAHNKSAGTDIVDGWHVSRSGGRLRLVQLPKPR